MSSQHAIYGFCMFLRPILFGYARWLSVGCRVWLRACRVAQLLPLSACRGIGGSCAADPGQGVCSPASAGQRGQRLLPRGSWATGNAAYHACRSRTNGVKPPRPKSGARRILMMLLSYAMFVSSSAARLNAPASSRVGSRASPILPASRAPGAHNHVPPGSYQSLSRSLCTFSDSSLRNVC